MEGKKSCVIYDSWGDLICNLPDELAGKLTKMILGYAFKGIETESDDPAVKAIFLMVRKKLDEDDEKYRSKVKRMADNSAPNNAETEPDTKSTRYRHDIGTKSTRYRHDIGGVSVSVNDNDKDLKEKQSKKKAAASAYSDDPELDKSIKSFIESRRNMRKPMTGKAVELFCKHLENLAPGNHLEQISLINTAIERGWQTVYPPGDSKKREPRFKQNTYTADELSALDN